MVEFINRDFPGVTVEFISMAELRRGEIKEPVVVYSRKGKVYVRAHQEFVRLFKPKKEGE
jgi:hypothetical protein